MLNQSASTPRPFESPGKEPKKRGRPRKIHTPPLNDQQGYPIGVPISTTANQTFPDSSTRSVMVDMGPILNPMGVKKRKYTKRPKEIDPLTGEVIKKPRKEGSGRKKKPPHDEATTQQINEVVNAVHLQLAKYKVEEEQRARQIAQQQQQQIMQQQVQLSAERDRGAHTLVMMQNRFIARAQDNSEKFGEVELLHAEQAGPSYTQTDSKSINNYESIQKLHLIREQVSSTNTPDIIHISSSANTPISRPYPTFSTDTQAAIEEIVHEIKDVTTETEEIAQMRKRSDTEELDAEVQLIIEGKDCSKSKKSKPTTKSKKSKENLSDYETDSESAIPSFLMEELQNLLLPFPRPVSPLVASCSKQYDVENVPINDKMMIFKPKMRLNNLKLDYNPRNMHFKDFGEFRRTCEKIRSIPTVCTQWSPPKKRLNKLKEKIRLIHAWKTVKHTQESFSLAHSSLDLSKLTLDPNSVEPLDRYEPPKSLDQFYEEIERLERHQGRHSILPLASSGDSDLLDVYETVSDIVDTVSSMDAILKPTSIIEFEEKDIFGLPVTPLFTALGEETTTDLKIPRRFYNVIMSKHHMRNRSKRKKKLTRIDDDLKTDDDLVNTSTSGEPDEDKRKASEKVEFGLSHSVNNLKTMDEIFQKQEMSLEDRINLRKSEYLTLALQKCILETSKHLKRMRDWTEDFIRQMQPETYSSWLSTLDCIQGKCPSDTEQLKYDQMTAFFLEVPQFKSFFKPRKNYDTNGGVTINPSNQMINCILQAKSPYFKSTDLADFPRKLDGVNGGHLGMIHEVKSHAITQIKHLEQDYMNVDDLDCLCSPYTSAKALAEMIQSTPNDTFREMALYEIFEAKEDTNGDGDEPAANLVEEFMISGQDPIGNKKIPSEKLLESLSEERRKNLLKDIIHQTREMSACIIQSMHERSAIMKQCHDALEEAFINLITSAPAPEIVDEFEFLSDSENIRSSDDSDPDNNYTGSTISRPIFKKKYKKKNTPFKKPLPARGLKYKKRGSKT